VVFLLFAIGVAATAGYQAIVSANQLSLHASDAGRALAIAQAGLRRYLGTIPADVTDTVELAIEQGEAFVWGRRIYRSTFPTERWLLTARGEFADPSLAGSPALRTVRQQATLWWAPLTVQGVVASTANFTTSGGSISASDNGTATQCAGAPRSATRTVFSGSQGFNASAVLDSLDVPWSMLEDPTFPVDYENTFPPLSLPATEYPVVRFNGPLNVSILGASGSDQRRGVLIVTGQLTIQSAFNWDGIILAGSLASPVGHSGFALDGVMAVGLNGTTPNASLSGGVLRYNSCQVLAAGAPLAMFRPLDGTWVEVY
jgi:hypothetical protein